MLLKQKQSIFPTFEAMDATNFLFLEKGNRGQGRLAGGGSISTYFYLQCKRNVTDRLNNQSMAEGGLFKELIHGRHTLFQLAEMIKHSLTLCLIKV